MRMIALAAFACIAIGSGAARCETPDAGEEKGRYSFKDVADGLLRLDSRTGHVSLCRRGNVGWACEAVPEDRAALEDEIGRLDSENQRFRKDYAARGLPLPDGVRGEPRLGSRSEDRVKIPDDADLDRVMAFMERAWRRILEMVQRLNRETEEKKSDRM